MDTEVKKKSTDELIYFQDPKRKAFVCFVIIFLYATKILVTLLLNEKFLF